MATSAVGGARLRWASDVRRHPVSPAAAVRPGVALPQRYAVFGRTAPGPSGPVRTLLGLWGLLAGAVAVAVGFAAAYGAGFLG